MNQQGRSSKRFSSIGSAIAVKSAGFKTGNLIILAQAITVLINPLLAVAML